MGQNTLFVTSKDGTKICAEAKGDPSNPCVVFVHGMSTGMGCFDEIFADPVWVERAFLIRYDIRGHGMSPVDTEDSVKWESARFAEDFDAVIKHFGVTRPFYAGWSYGCAWNFPRSPETLLHVNQLIVFNAGSIPIDILTAHDPTYLSGLILMAPLPYVAFHDAVRPEALGVVPGITNLTDVSLFKSDTITWVDSFTVKPMKYSTRFTILGAVLAQPGKAFNVAFSRPQDLEIYPRVAAAGKLPLLLVLGQQDRVVFNEKVQEYYKNTLKWVSMETAVFDAGHAVWLDCHDEVRQSILGFVAR